MLYGRVTGRFLAPDGTPLSGSVRFTPEVSAVLVSGVDPATVVPSEVSAVLDAEGRITRGGAVGVDLMVPELGVTNPVAWTWRVTPYLMAGGRYLSLPPWSVDVTPTGLDLTVAAPVPSSTGEGITRGASAYEVAVANGYSGTEAQWLDSLAAGGVDLTGYVTDAELSTALTPYALDSDIPPAPDLTGYALTSDVVLTVNGTPPDTSGNVSVATGQVYSSGWRDVTPDFLGARYARIRRDGDRVTVQAWSVTANYGASIYTLPEGFRGRDIVGGGLLISAAHTVVNRTQIGNSSGPSYDVFWSEIKHHGIAVSGNLTDVFAAEWYTSDAEPTILPGAPA